MGEDAKSLQQRVGEWAEATFPTSTLRTICAHLFEEVEELCEEVEGNDLGEVSRPRVREECADVFLILQHLAHRLDFDLQTVAEAKFAECQRRKWAFDPAVGYVRHVEEGAPDAD